jgi:hypothetical protein
MAKHRALRHLLRALPALLAVVLAATVISGPAGAATARLRVVGQDTVDKFNCQMTVSSVDTVHGTLTATIAGNAFPSSLFSSIVRNEIVCVLTDGAQTTFLGELDKTANSSRVSGTVTLVVPLFSSYQLCGAAGYTTRNGTSSATSAVCQTG